MGQVQWTHSANMAQLVKSMSRVMLNGSIKVCEGRSPTWKHREPLSTKFKSQSNLLKVIIDGIKESYEELGTIKQQYVVDQSQVKGSDSGSKAYKRCLFGQFWIS